MSKLNKGTSLMVQGLRLHTPNAGGPGSIPGQGKRSYMLQQRYHVLHLRPGTDKQIINIFKTQMKKKHSKR